MAKTKPYTAKTLAGAQRRVRELEKVVENLKLLINAYGRDREQMAKLAADGPAFDNPIEAAEAKQHRDEILRIYCGLNPNGTRIKRASNP